MIFADLFKSTRLGCPVSRVSIGADWPDLYLSCWTALFQTKCADGGTVRVPSTFSITQRDATC